MGQEIGTKKGHFIVLTTVEMRQLKLKRMSANWEYVKLEGDNGDKKYEYAKRMYWRENDGTGDWWTQYYSDRIGFLWLRGKVENKRFE